MPDNSRFAPDHLTMIFKELGMVQRTRNYVVVRKDPFGHQYPAEAYYSTWNTSPRVNGKLKLVAQPYALEHSHCTDFSFDAQGCEAPQPFQYSGSFPETEKARLSARNVALAKIRGKLYKGNAALGVTVASLGQSREMINSRARRISVQAEEILSDFGRRYEVKGRVSKRFADTTLETVFGWKPLLADIHAATSTVIQGAETVGYVRGSHTGNFSHDRQSTSPDGHRKSFVSANGTVMVTFASRYSVSNPNAWLAERAGLTNYAAIAWDLVPWSFVVNMFANTAALVNSVTDYASIHFDDLSETTTYRNTGSMRTSYDETFTWPFPHRIESYGRSSWKVTQKNRELLGSLPRPTLELKLPNMNWELAAIATSLLVQKVSSVGKVLRVIDTKRYTS